MQTQKTLTRRHVWRFPDIHARLRKAVRVRQQRTALRELDDHLLRDIGVTRQQARKEGQRGFWDF
ncbi:MAG: DUF1127 domain-containing protein [Pseudomonadota bacterium]